MLQALILWLFISGLTVGGALAFHRLFPLESPWFGFFVPALALVVLMNFLEHFVALPNLLLLFPVLVALVGWFLLRPGLSYRPVVLPAAVFLASFAFTYLIRCLQPDILTSSDGLSDLNKINNFCQGGTLPPIDTWLPPYHYIWYYSLQHYAASIIKRLFDVQLGVAYNAAHALLSALTCVAGAAVAHRLSGGRTWITWTIPFLIESAATGSSALIQLTTHDPSLWYANNVSGGVIDYDKAAAASQGDHFSLLWKWLALDPHRERLELQVPGFWTWRDEYHANSSGHFLTLLSMFVVAELSPLRRAMWPWIFAVLAPILAVDSSTWAYPISLLLCGGMVAIALRIGRRPATPGLGALILLTAIILIWPSLYDVTASPIAPGMMPTKPEEAAPWREFILQWWPIIVLWICGWCSFRVLPPGVRWILFVLPAMLIGVEWITVEGRYNTVEKMWGYTYGTGLVALFPIVAQRAEFETLFQAVWRRGSLATFPYRVITVVLLLSAAISFYAWMKNTLRWAPWGTSICHLEGDGYILADDQKRKMLQILTQVKRATFLSGKAAWCYNESPTLAVFTGNRSYSAWFYFESVADFPEEALYRANLNNEFYAGTMADPLKFLQSNRITGVIIWPDDQIPDGYLATLTKELQPAYDYIDCRGDGPHNAGVFLVRPLPLE